MYFNNVHILVFVLIATIGLIVGKFCAWCNLRIPENKKIFSKDFFEENKKGLPFNYVFMITTTIIYIAILYKFGIKKDEILMNLDLIKLIILVPMLLLTFFIDLKHRIIPNRLTLTMFEFGLAITFIYGITNVNMAKDYIIAMFVGAGIFFLITLLGKIISGKEVMGFGDVKFMGALGLFFGINTISEITLLSFLISAICSVIIIVFRLIKKDNDEYIPFGPFLVISTIICIFIPSGYIIDVFLLICRKISDKILMF